MSHSKNFIFDIIFCIKTKVSGCRLPPRMVVCVKGASELPPLREAEKREGGSLYRFC
jgi:hypothetical protein